MTSLFATFVSRLVLIRERYGGGQGSINSFTVQYLVSITSPKGEKQAAMLRNRTRKNRLI